MIARPDEPSADAGIALVVRRDRFAIDGVFRIARGSRAVADVVTVELSQGEPPTSARGRGECYPYARYGETLESVEHEIESLRTMLSCETSAAAARAALQVALPAGAARNALDCALWDLEAKQSATSVWQLAGLQTPIPVTTAYTLSIDTAEAMRAVAARESKRPLLKIKLGGEGAEDADLARLRAVRDGAPHSRLIVDANEGWSAGDYRRLAPVMLSLGVALVEQPLAAGDDAELASTARPLPVCADESCHDRTTLDALDGRYDLVNIKLDKTGGLTEALALRDAARARGFGVMVGCMTASSLAMAPALLVAQGADFVDLDGPLLLAEDRADPIIYDVSLAHPATAALWG